MLQFLTMNVQAIYNMVNGCPYPQRILRFYLIYIISLFALFMQFYRKRWAGSKRGGKSGGEKAAVGDAPASDKKTQ